MTPQQLLEKMHTYTKIERYLKNHPDIRKDKSKIQKFDAQLSHQDAQETLVDILPHLKPDATDGWDTLPASFFFKKNDPLNICVTQHTRYSTPIMHNHDFFELFYVFEGEFEQQIGNKTFTMHTGDFCLITPGVYHMLDVNNYSIVINILIKKSVFNALFINKFNARGFENVFSSNANMPVDNSFIIFSTKADIRIKNIILDLYLETLNREEYYPYIVRSKLVTVLSYIMRRYSSDAIMAKPAKKIDVVDFNIMNKLDSDYSTITLEQIKSEFNYSSQYISYRVKKMTGLSFTKYLIYKRMHEAAKLLETTSIKVKEISQQVGYPQQESFTRLFKRTFNKTPSQYRKDSHSENIF
ncbi:AraC family transcriptional regulator [Dellaglioa sp. BT-FLS60]